MTEIQNYNLFFKFLETYSPMGFKEINPLDPLVLDLEKLMNKNKQFLYVADLIQMKVLFTSKRSIDMIGVEPKDVSPYIFMGITHPKDIQRLNIGRTKLIKLGQDIFIAKEGMSIISTNFRMLNAQGKHSQFLIQGYLFYTTITYETVFFLKLHTNIDWCKKIKHGYHYYVGEDISKFRYPDKELLNIGNIFTRREFEILKLIALGHDSEQIGKELFLSLYTVNTHRGNILKKTNKSHVSDVIYDLKERGLL